MRYFFDVYNGETTKDEEGLDFPTAKAAIAEAGRAVSGMSAGIIDGGTISVEVRDSAGIVAVVSVSIDIDRKRPS